MKHPLSVLDTIVWNKEISVPESVISYVDPGLLKKLPEGTKPIRVSASGASYWARTAKLTAVDAKGREDDYFFKVHQGERGRKMVSAEYESMMKLYRVMPEIVARPVGWGAYEEMEDTYFCVCEYHEMSGDVPNISNFPALVAELHKRGASLDGRFGYALMTYGGNNPQLFPPSDSWEECFRLGLGAIMDAEVKTHGPDADLEKLNEQTVTKVIPRLLKPLETEGRSIVPRLVHGDLWDGNCSVDVATGQPLIFDATPLYAHSEYELGPWRCSRHKMSQAFLDEYVKHMSISEPTEEFDDRGALYNLRFDVHASSLYPGNLTFRERNRETLCRLVEKYGEGFEGYAKRHGISA